VLLDRYPLPEAAWAQRAQDPRLAQRFELYACGVELANGFAEITDAAEQRRRFEDAMNERQRRYGEQYPIDDDFLAAMPTMPPSSGIALGFDRLVMMLTGATRIEQVLWAPVAGGDR
jgi:lysyl-tRNA synthetase class 2